MIPTDEFVEQRLLDDPRDKKDSLNIPSISTYDSHKLIITIEFYQKVWDKNVQMQCFNSRVVMCPFQCER